MSVYRTSPILFGTGIVMRRAEGSEGGMRTRDLQRSAGVRRSESARGESGAQRDASRVAVR
jgi:hypothetical protein